MANVLFLSADVVAGSMAGPGIRYWELANALSAYHDVTLAVPNRDLPAPMSCEVVSYAEQPLESLMRGRDVLITQTISPILARLSRRQRTRIALDAYDPALLEVLEHARHLSLEEQRRLAEVQLAQLRLGLRLADMVICASEKQRDLLVGALMLAGRVSADAYRRDPSLRSLLAVVPFGIQDREPQRTGPGFRDRLGIAPTDTVLLWGGGIWNWFDPLTLIRAVAAVSQTRDDIKLVFMGLRHPNDNVPEMAMGARAIALARELNLDGRSVFFNEGWVPYQERQNHLLDASLGVSAHLDHLETRFAFRTRILDYFWAGLPVICTVGDALGELVDRRGLGMTVGYQDVGGWADAIVRLADDERLRGQAVGNVRAVREEYRWSRVAARLREAIDRVLDQPRDANPIGAADLAVGAVTSLAVVRAQLQEKGTRETARWLSRQTRAFVGGGRVRR